MREVARAGWSRVGWAGMGLLVVALVLSGVVMHQPEPALADWSEGQSPWRHLATVGHGVLAWLICLWAGRWIWPHVTLMWRRRTRGWLWWLGLLTLLVTLGLAGSGLLLLYGPAEGREAVARVHWWLGLCWPAVGAVHATRRLRPGRRA